MEEQIQQLWQALQVFLNDSAPLPDRADGALNLFVFFVQWSAVILSALAGLYAAHKRGMDFFGSLVIAFIVPLGGGTLRDLLLGRYPIFWIAEPVYAVTVVVIALLSIFVGREAKRSKTVAKVAQPVEHITEFDATVDGAFFASAIFFLGEFGIVSSSTEIVTKKSGQFAFGVVDEALLARGCYFEFL